MTMGTGWDNVLKQAAIPVLTNQNCAATMGGNVGPNMICIGYPDGSHGGCMVCTVSILVLVTCDILQLIYTISYEKRGVKYVKSAECMNTN